MIGRARPVLLIAALASGVAVAQSQRLAPDTLPATAVAQLEKSLEAARVHSRHVWRDTPPINDDGTVKRLPELLTFARQHRLRIVSIADLIQYRQRFEKLVSRVDSFAVDLGFAAAQGIVYATPTDNIRHFALCIGDLRREPVAVRIHRESVFDDVFGAVAPGRVEFTAPAQRNTVLPRTVTSGSPVMWSAYVTA